MLPNLGFTLRNANHIKIMMFLASMNALKAKFIELMIMVMLVKDTMEVLMNKLCKKKS